MRWHCFNSVTAHFHVNHPGGPSCSTLKACFFPQPSSPIACSFSSPSTSRAVWVAPCSHGATPPCSYPWYPPLRCSCWDNRAGGIAPIAAHASGKASWYAAVVARLYGPRPDCAAHAPATVHPEHCVRGMKAPAPRVQHPQRACVRTRGTGHRKRTAAERGLRSRCNPPLSVL